MINLDHNISHLILIQLSNSKEFHSRRNEESDSLSSSIIYSSVHGDTATETLQVSGPLTDLPKSPFVIESRVVTDIAMMVLLHDGFSETNLDGKDIQVSLQNKSLRDWIVYCFAQILLSILLDNLQNINFSLELPFPPIPHDIKFVRFYYYYSKYSGSQYFYDLAIL